MSNICTRADVATAFFLRSQRRPPSVPQHCRLRSQQCSGGCRDNTIVPGIVAFTAFVAGGFVHG